MYTTLLADVTQTKFAYAANSKNPAMISFTALKIFE